MNNGKKVPIEKRFSISEWKYIERQEAIEALLIAKKQDKPIKYLLK